jgi:hypothetical protein
LPLEPTREILREQCLQVQMPYYDSLTSGVLELLNRPQPVNPV